MKKGDLISLKSHLGYLLDTLEHGVEPNFEGRKKRVEKDVEKLSTIIDGFKDIDVSDENIELLLIPFKIDDWSKQKSGGLCLTHEACTFRIKTTDDETGKKKDMGSVQGMVGGGIQIVLDQPDGNIHYTMKNYQAWDAIVTQVGRDDLILTKDEDDGEEE